MSNSGSWSRSPFYYERIALNALLSERAYLSIFLALSTSISVLYMFLLPSLPLGSIIPTAIYFITPIQIAFAVIFGVLVSLVATLNLYALRMRATSLSKANSITIGSVIASLVNLLCCTPLIPSMLALFGASTPILFDYSPKIQAFFEFNYPYFYILSAVILLVSVHYVSKNISCCRRVNTK